MKFLLILLVTAFIACSGQQSYIKPTYEIMKSKYSSHEKIEKILKSQSQRSSLETTYIIFAADFCGTCNKLYDLLKEAGVEKRVYFLDVEKTWVFLFSKEMNISSLPTMAVIKNNKTIEVKKGLNNILMYLVAHLNKNKEIKLIQNEKHREDHE